MAITVYREKVIGGKSIIFRIVNLPKRISATLYHVAPISDNQISCFFCHSAPDQGFHYIMPAIRTSRSAGFLHILYGRHGSCSLLFIQDAGNYHPCLGEPRHLSVLPTYCHTVRFIIKDLTCGQRQFVGICTGSQKIKSSFGQRMVSKYCLAASALASHLPFPYRKCFSSGLIPI